MVPRLLILALLAPATAALGADGLDAAAGRALFERNWVSAPASTRAGEGLGPLYDARSCGACHEGAGPGRVETVGEGLVVRLGRRDGGADPVYGSQLQTHALPGVPPEAEVSVRWSTAGGARRPSLQPSGYGYGALGAGTHAALRRAPALFGLAALETVSDAEILSHTAPGHGRPAWVTDAAGQRRLGRWGWKAAEADLGDQTDSALQRDIGVSTPARPEPWGECTPSEAACRTLAGTGGVEASAALRGLIVAYLRALPAPPRADDPEGARAFQQAGCGACHRSLRTPDGEELRAGTDLLLHDLGPGLDDGIAEGDARPPEWRTAPLWNLSAELAAGGLLHDGRARSIAEAVRWHGGEAAGARARFASLPPGERAGLERYLLRQRQRG